jgi:hypothetical protein
MAVQLGENREMQPNNNNNVIVAFFPHITWRTCQCFIHWRLIIQKCSDNWWKSRSKPKLYADVSQ